MNCEWFLYLVHERVDGDSAAISESHVQRKMTPIHSHLLACDGAYKGLQ